ncbi:hypothetical protein GUJ67_06700 [Enterococcus hirae]|uniref:hypothetical protein n=1 Tax=Enterococcus hirae TaxID=1354 RepID=UPI001360D19B|nr:hypothetical protein [Enterococcus hirae]NAB49580.1 hypothetical protein [Enterococcus hirae]NAB80418.1 hypothetical protein [Enterococcus hirae]NAD30437.1 hypothetical protein [Enterococcus hirae]NAD50619.1 hypothetical protein [Enterococcus hirae]NAD58314.1 hypothetical protein [Enterococcus hirae]
MALDRLILNRNKFKKNREAFDIKGAHGSFFQTMNLCNSLAKTIYFLFFINTIKEYHTVHVKPINHSNFLPLLSLTIN